MKVRARMMLKAWSRSACAVSSTVMLDQDTQIVGKGSVKYAW